MSRGWRAAAAAVAGTKHAASGERCQDAVRVQQCGETLILAVADGAGSSQLAAEGADAAVRILSACLEQRLRGTPLERWSEADARACLEETRSLLSGLADEAGASLRDLACTLMAAAANATRALLVQIGDGAIVLSAEAGEDWCWMFEPHRGQYANETSFLSDEDAVARANVAIVPAPAELAMFTDGLERLLIQEGPQRTVVSAFFQQMMPPIRELTAAGCDSNLSRLLTDYLGSEAIRERTDDDCTLVLATRLAVPSLQPAG